MTIHHKTFKSENLSIFILLSFLIPALRTYPQAYVPIATEKASWKVRSVNDGGNPIIYGEWKYTTGTDTIIEGNTYTSLVDTEDQIYLGAFFEDSSMKVYFVPKDSTKSYLLYDFSVEIGDTITNVFPALQDTMIVNQIDTFYWQDPNYPELGRRWISLIKPDVAAVLIGGTWVEGVGSMAGLIDATYEEFFESSVNLQCFQIDTISYLFHECSPVGVAEINSPGVKSNIFPNPASGILNIEINNYQDIVEMIWYDIRGTIVKREIISPSMIHRSNISMLMNGIYFVRLIDGSGQILESKKIIIQH